MSRNVAKVSSDFRHTAGVSVTGRSVAKSSFLRHKCSFVVGGSAIVSTEDFFVSPGKQAKDLSL